MFLLKMVCLSSLLGALFITFIIILTIILITVIIITILIIIMIKFSLGAQPSWEPASQPPQSSPSDSCNIDIDIDATKRVETRLWSPELQNRYDPCINLSDSCNIHFSCFYTTKRVAPRVADMRDITE